jgi:hypothetical protein
MMGTRVIASAATKEMLTACEKSGTSEERRNVVPAIPV